MVFIPTPQDVMASSGIKLPDPFSSTESWTENIYSALSTEINNGDISFDYVEYFDRRYAGMFIEYDGYSIGDIVPIGSNIKIKVSKGPLYFPTVSNQSDINKLYRDFGYYLGEQEISNEYSSSEFIGSVIRIEDIDSNHTYEKGMAVDYNANTRYVLSKGNIIYPSDISSYFEAMNWKNSNDIPIYISLIEEYNNDVNKNGIIKTLRNNNENVTEGMELLRGDTISFHISKGSFPTIDISDSDGNIEWGEMTQTYEYATGYHQNAPTGFPYIDTSKAKLYYQYESRTQTWSSYVNTNVDYDACKRDYVSRYSTSCLSGSWSGSSTKTRSIWYSGNDRYYQKAYPYYWENGTNGVATSTDSGWCSQGGYWNLSTSCTKKSGHLSGSNRNVWTVLTYKSSLTWGGWRGTSWATSVPLDTSSTQYRITSSKYFYKYYKIISYREGWSEWQDFETIYHNNGVIQHSQVRYKYSETSGKLNEEPIDTEYRTFYSYDGTFELLSVSVPVVPIGYQNIAIIEINVNGFENNDITRKIEIRIKKDTEILSVEEHEVSNGIVKISQNFTMPLTGFVTVKLEYLTGSIDSPMIVIDKLNTKVYSSSCKSYIVQEDDFNISLPIRTYKQKGKTLVTYYEDIEIKSNDNNLILNGGEGFEIFANLFYVNPFEVNSIVSDVYLLIPENSVYREIAVIENMYKIPLTLNSGSYKIPYNYIEPKSGNVYLDEINTINKPDLIQGGNKFYTDFLQQPNAYEYSINIEDLGVNLLDVRFEKQYTMKKSSLRTYNYKIIGKK